MPPYVPLNGPQAPPAPEPLPGPPACSPLFWVGQALLLPFRLMGLLLLILLLPGVVQLWSLPTLAEKEQLDPTLLALRAIDQEKAVTPLLPLGYRPAARAGMIDLCAPGDHYEHMALTMLTA